MEENPKIEDKIEEKSHQKAGSGKHSRSTIREDEIDLGELIKFIWTRKWFVAKIAGMFIIIGLVIAFTTPVEFKSSTILIPETAGEDGGIGNSIGGLASLAGVDLGNLSPTSQTINPALYQSVSRSTPFLLELIRQEYYFGTIDKRVTLYDYYLNYYEVSLVGRMISIPGKLISWIKGSKSAGSNKVKDPPDGILRLSEYEEIIMKDLRSRVLVEMDWDLNLVTIQVEMQDPLVAAEMSIFTQKYITQYVSEYATSKSLQQLRSLEKQYNEKKQEFEQVQLRLALLMDQNQNITTARAKSEEERLQSEYSLAFNVYNQLAQQLESVKLKVQEETPVFTILEPTKVPIDKDRPKRSLILIISTLLGGSLGIVIVLIKDKPLHFK